MRSTARTMVILLIGLVVMLVAALGCSGPTSMTASGAAGAPQGTAGSTTVNITLREAQPSAKRALSREQCEEQRQAALMRGNLLAAFEGCS